MLLRKPRVRRMVVREDVPLRRVLAVAGLLVAVLLAGLGGWWLGRQSLLVALAGEQGRIDGAGLLERLADENRTMRDELAVYRNGDELTRAVEERVRTDNRELQDRIAELEQAVAYYRRVAVPDRSGKGLRIEGVDLVSAGSAQDWSLTVFLVRTGETDGTLEGHIDGTLTADGPGGRVAMPLSRFIPAGQQGFRVRYVTDMKVELHLPAGMVPVRLDVAAVLTAPRADRIEKSWQRQAAGN